MNRSRCLLLVLSAALALAAPAEAGRPFRSGRQLPAPLPPPLVATLVSGATPVGSWAATVQPPANGNPAAYGYGAFTIASFTDPAWQTFNTPQQIGVVAWHQPSAAEYAAGVEDNISKVSCQMDNGPEVDAILQTNNPTWGVPEWNFNLDPSIPDGLHEVRCTPNPTTGTPRVLQGPATSSSGIYSLFINTNFNATLPRVVRYVSNAGSDSNDGLSPATPLLTIEGCKTNLSAAMSGDIGGGICYLAAGTYVGAASPAARAANNQWWTVSAAPGVDKGDVVVTSITSTSGFRVEKVRLFNLTLSNTGVSSTTTVFSRKPAIWLDSVVYNGRGLMFAGNPYGSAATWGLGIYCTNSEITNTEIGCDNANLVANTNTHDISSDAWQNNLVTINSVASNLGDYFYLGAHGDIAVGDTCLRNITGNLAAFVPGGLIVSATTSGGLPASGGSLGAHAKVASVGTCGAPNTVQMSSTDAGWGTTIPSIALTQANLGSGFHPDCYQMVITAGLDQSIVYRATCLVGIDAQAYFASHGITVKNAANVESFWSNTSYPSGFTMQLGGPTSNLFILRSTLYGNKAWRYDAPNNFSADTVSVVNSTCVVSPVDATPLPIATDGSVTGTPPVIRGGTC